MRGKRAFAASVLFIITALLLLAALLHQRGRVTILMYHHFVTDGGETNSLTVTEGKFRRDMEYLRAQGYETLLPDELSAILSGRQPCPEKAVVISFDDGYHSNYQYAYPILQETGCRAVIALNTAYILDSPQENAFMLSWAEVREMAASGYAAFGSHTDNLHNPDTGGDLRTGRNAANGVERLPAETPGEYHKRVGSDLARSCAVIEAHTGVPVQWFAYPYGAGDRWCERELDELDIPISVLTNPGSARVGSLRGLPRFAVREDTDLSALLP